MVAVEGGDRESARAAPVVPLGGKDPDLADFFGDLEDLPPAPEPIRAIAQEGVECLDVADDDDLALAEVKAEERPVSIEPTSRRSGAGCPAAPGARCRSVASVSVQVGRRSSAPPSRFSLSEGQMPSGNCSRSPPRPRRRRASRVRSSSGLESCASRSAAGERSCASAAASAPDRHSSTSSKPSATRAVREVPSASALSTSSRAPPAKIPSVRASIRSYSLSRSMSEPEDRGRMPRLGRPELRFLGFRRRLDQ